MDVPATDAVFTTDGVVESDRVYGRDVLVQVVWRQYAVYFVRPPAAVDALAVEGERRVPAEILVFKISVSGPNRLVNIRTRDARVAKKAART